MPIPLAAVSDRSTLVGGGLIAVCIASALHLWSSRGKSDSRMTRAIAWLVFIIAVLAITFLAYVLWFADFSWMNQR